MWNLGVNKNNIYNLSIKIKGDDQMEQQEFKSVNGEMVEVLSGKKPKWLETYIDMLEMKRKKEK